ncbi:uncharacterized protein LOC141642733 [Silene latifolia]|uniref:uncharacterized protein LOC141642733 n=1 Tax=Silene latifolia TaxID=37657 RepID=UPI003D76A750
MGKECGSSTFEDSSTDHFISSTLAFISDDDSLFTKYFNFICEKAEEMKQAGSKLPLYESFCKEHEKGKHEKGEHEKGKDERNGGFAFDPEKYKVVYSREKGKNKVSDVAVEKPNEEVPTDDGIDNIDVENETVDLSSVDDVVNKVVNEGVVGDRIQDNSVISAYLLHSDVMPEHTFFGICGIGCDLDCESPNPDAVVVSVFLCKYKELFAPILMRRKTVLDYCFLHDHDLRIGEDLVVFSFHHMLTRDDIISLSAKTMITSNVIDCWSFLLNDMLVKVGKGLSPTRSFFCTSHSEISNVWDTVIENSEGSLDIGADLVIFPILSVLSFFC